MEENVKKKKGKLSKDAINIIRTTQRNNIELTHIADNKANVLLSLNAIMLTFLVPMVLANMELIYNERLYIPLIILMSTCFSTIYIATIVLKPSKFKNFRNNKSTKENISPFFFGNIHKMQSEEYFTYMESQLKEPKKIQMYLTQDLFYIGKRLGFKMNWIRRAFNIFLIGLFLSLLSTVVILGVF